MRKIITLYIEILYAIRSGFRSSRFLALLSVSSVIAVSFAVLFMLIEHWRFVDALYFAVVSMATVGYGDLSPQTDLGKLISIPFLMIGIGMFVLTVSELALSIFKALEENHPSGPAT
jgi:voltage-gated potassium channel